ncbi:hypothetical protein FNE59_20430 [Bacillus thuringiensis]|uniref:hypothetical protein n=1 Tax=Bacillus cereus group TaxID=86661 RepID=UPI0018F6503E|nr:MULTISPECIES: hypothetical protein [Bacillus cereus group]MBJ7935573.1 hypothetical protein [Bacillus cereus]MDR5047881.1 hypothetical protein [Bacillus thuringiensis]
MGYTFIFLLGWIIGLLTGLTERLSDKIKKRRGGKMNNPEGLSFGQMLDEIKEGDKAECLDFRYDSICCIDNEVLVWELSEEVVRLNGDFFRMKWKILKGASEL